MREREQIPDGASDRLVSKKTEWAAGGVQPGRRVPGDPAGRIPPGQHVPSGWPVLDLGIKPRLTRETWKLEIDGLVASPQTLDWPAFSGLRQVELTTDFHCVTTWSTLDNRWSGVPFREIVERVRPGPEARFLVFGAHDGYTTNLPLDVCLDEDVLLAHSWDGRPLTRDHGGPVRMIIPKRYAWKGAKWIQRITFAAEDQPGFWEVRGYSNDADPWKEERFA